MGVHDMHSRKGMNIKQMKKKVYNVGVKGICNAYLVKGDCNVLIDGVPEHCRSQYFENIKKLVPDMSVDYFICCHAAPDKCSVLQELLDKTNAVVCASAAGLKNISEIINRKFRQRVCKNRSVLSAGGAEFVFFNTPYTPWPDTVIVYEKTEKALFSGELFSGSRNFSEYFSENFKGREKYVSAALDIARGLDINNVYPAKGEAAVFSEVINEYEHLAKPVCVDANKITIVYASNFGCTKAMAECIKNVLLRNGYNAECFDAQSNDISVICEKIYTSCAVAVGTPTCDRKPSQRVWELISKLNVSLVSGKPYFVFGSTGWSGEGVNIASETMKLMRMRRFAAPVTAVFTPSDEELEKLEKYTAKFVRFVSEVQNA